ncbi:excisionase family DNA binding domain [Paenibacillus sp. FSL R7-269]|uniref:helix-turn-helix domain-containing protein n=1 Tax=Paenibacillus sp. FSL R7-269 TaxID=1226755 RepID=UPI0003E27370|nr:helix-turn-helix domain-containing protein [Paenibacillus sp. FSL R7-269]ETT56800.1 excisionase family DNA binding domain [Paenibacillus sp. FSL R7-269]
MRDMQKQYYTVNELMGILPLGRNTVYKLVGKDDFPKIKIGNKILIPVAGLNNFLQEHQYGTIELN